MTHNHLHNKLESFPNKSNNGSSKSCPATFACICFLYSSISWMNTSWTTKAPYDKKKSYEA